MQNSLFYLAGGFTFTENTVGTRAAFFSLTALTKYILSHVVFYLKYPVSTGINPVTRDLEHYKQLASENSRFK